jgi:hypothetical protein
MTTNELHAAVASLQLKIQSQYHTVPLSPISVIVINELEKQMRQYTTMLTQEAVAASAIPDQEDLKINGQ